MSRRPKAPQWLILALILILATMLLLLWLPSGERPARLARVEQPAAVARPPVIYEEELQHPVHQPPAVATDETAIEPAATGLALIIDDVGYDMHALDRLLKLPFTVAISVLPDAPQAREAADEAYAAGHVVMLHLPMEPANPKYQAKMDDAFLTQGMDRQKVDERIAWALSRVPHAEGVNNHMGSLLTTMPETMDWVMEACRAQKLFFVDSKTAHGSVAAAAAARHGLVWGERRIFLDHTTDIEDMTQAWNMARKCAARPGGCIVIGHPYPETISFLEQHVPAGDYALFRPVTRLLHGGKQL